MSKCVNVYFICFFLLSFLSSAYFTSVMLHYRKLYLMCRMNCFVQLEVVWVTFYDCPWRQRKGGTEREKKMKRERATP